MVLRTYLTESGGKRTSFYGLEGSSVRRLLHGSWLIAHGSEQLTMNGKSQV